MDPLHQGLGVGSALLRELVARADRAGVGCRLETANPRNVPVYERHGFRPVARQTIIDVDVVFMWRNPA